MMCDRTCIRCFIRFYRLNYVHYVDYVEDKPRDFWRTVKRGADQLHFYLSGEFYDCSFKVGSQETEYKIFKCHKMILSMASVVFDKAFGSFKEASMHKDDPILLDKVSPAVFDIAMKCIYGDFKNFEGIPTAVQVYHFAYEMQIQCLMESIDEYLKCIAVPENVFAVLDLYSFFENNEALHFHLAVVGKDIVAAFNSSYWLEASPETVENLLTLNVLNLEVVDLFQFIVTWAEFQVFGKIEKVRLSDFDTSENEKVREKVLPFFKFIQFGSMDPLRFKEMCRTCTVLTKSEMMCISREITLNSLKELPKPLSSSQKSEEYVTVILPYEQLGKKRYLFQDAGFKFLVNRDCHLVGFNIDEQDLNFGKLFDDVTITLDGMKQSFTNLTMQNGDASEIFFKLEPKPFLKKGVQYTLNFHKTGAEKRCGHLYLINSIFKTLSSNDISVTLCPKPIFIFLTKMIFDVVY